MDCVAITQLCSFGESSCGCVNEEAGLGSSKTLFTKAGFGLNWPSGYSLDPRSVV